MAANKIVEGMKDYIWSKPNTKGTKDDQELLRLRGLLFPPFVESYLIVIPNGPL